MMQTCTDKMKIRALRQEARRMGATTNRNAQGIHFTEALRRIKGRFLHDDPAGPWSVYQTNVKTKTGHKDVKWQTHYYPLVDLKMTRAAVYDSIEKEGIPYLISSECDGCPHKDLARWERTSPAVIEDLAQIEADFKGQYFFTPQRIPLKDAILLMQAERKLKPEPVTADVDFGCGTAICGV